MGATGSAGSTFIDALLTAGFDVSALTRNAAKAKFDNRVNVVESDYSPGSLIRAFQGQDAIVSALATFSVSEQIKVIDAAVEAGVKRFVPSEYGIDSQDPAVGEQLPPIKPKQDATTYLKSKQDTGLTWTALIVGGWFDWALGIPGLMAYNIPERKVTVFDGGDIPHEFTNLGQIGRAVAAVLKPEHVQATANTYVYVNSFTLTQNEVVAALEKVTGDKVEVTPAKRREVAELGKQKMATGKFIDVAGSQYLDGSGEAITAQIYNLDGHNNFSKNRGLWNDKLGLPRESLEETLRRVIK